MHISLVSLKIRFVNLVILGVLFFDASRQESSIESMQELPIGMGFSDLIPVPKMRICSSEILVTYHLIKVYEWGSNLLV